MAGGSGRRIIYSEAARSNKRLHKQGRQITSLRKAAASIDLDEILQRVAAKYHVDPERLIARGESSHDSRTARKFKALMLSVRFDPEQATACNREWRND
jgi:hypothetical protein